MSILISGRLPKLSPHLPRAYSRPLPTRHTPSRAGKPAHPIFLEFLIVMPVPLEYNKSV